MILKNSLTNWSQVRTWVKDQTRLLIFQPRLWYVLLCFILFYSALLLRYVERFDLNMSGLITIGDHFIPQDILRDGTITFEGSMGYDGQFYYIMAHDPFIRKGMTQYLDIPAYRYQRIMYPWLVSVFSLGNHGRIPLMLVLVNFAGIIVGTCFVALMLREQRMNLWYALFYGFLSGLFITTVRDMSGPLAVGFMVGGVFFYSRKRHFLCALFLSAAILTREIILPVLPVLALDSFFFKKDLKGAILSMLPLFPFLIWQLYVFQMIHAVSWHPGMLGMPLMGIMTNLQKIPGLPNWICPEILYLFLFLVVTVVSFAFAVQEIFHARNEISICFLLFSALPFFMTESMWVEPWGYARVFLPSAVFLVLSFIKSRRNAYLIPLTIHGLLFVVTLKWLYVI
jgi:hypothetical protein